MRIALVLMAAGLASAGCTAPLDDGTHCPCVEGYWCDPAADLCRRGENTVGEDGAPAGAPDAGGTDAFMDGSPVPADSGTVGPDAGSPIQDADTSGDGSAGAEVSSLREGAPATERPSL